MYHNIKTMNKPLTLNELHFKKKLEQYLDQELSKVNQEILDKYFITDPITGKARFKPNNTPEDQVLHDHIMRGTYGER